MTRAGLPGADLVLPAGGAAPPIAVDGLVRGQAVRPFLMGTAVGGVAGAIVGGLLSQPTRRLLVALIHLAGRRLNDADRDRLRFELLLQ